MNQTFHDLTLTGRITFADGSIFDSASSNNFANVSGFSRNLVDGTTSLLQDRLLLHQDVACATNIQVPQVSFQVLEFMNDLDGNGLPIMQTKGFSNELHSALLLAQERTSFLANLFNQVPIAMGWSENDRSIVLDYNGLAIAGIEDSHQSHLTNTELHILDRATNDEMFLDHNGLVLLQMSTQHQIEFTPTILDFQNAENLVSIGHSTYQNAKVGFEAFNLLTGANCNLEPEQLTCTIDSGQYSTFNASGVGVFNGTNHAVLINNQLTISNSGYNQVMMNQTGVTASNISSSGSLQPGLLAASDGVHTTTITPTQITTGTLNYTTLNPAISLGAITSTSTNDAEVYNILLQHSSGAEQTIVYVDNNIGPLQYNPSLSQLNCGSVYSASTSNVMSLLTGPTSANPYLGWTSSCDLFTSGVSITYNVLYLSAVSVRALQTITGLTLYFTAGNSSGNIIMGLYSSNGTLVRSTTSTALPTSETKKDIALSSTYTPSTSGTLWIGILVSNSVSILGTTNKILSPTPVANTLNGLHATFSLGSYALPNPFTGTVTNSGIHLWSGYW